MKEMYDWNDGISVSIINTISFTIDTLWKLFHSNPRGIQAWPAMAFTRPVSTIMKLYKSKSTFLNVFNYLCSYPE